MVFSRPSADPSSSVPDPIELKLKGANKESHDQVHNLSDSVGNNPENNQKLMGLAQVMAGNLAKDIASMSQPPTMDQLAEMIGKDEAMSGLTPLQQNQLAEYVLSVPVIPVDGGAAPSQTMQASVMPGASFMSSMASGVTSLFKAGDKGESEETEEAHSAETTPSTDPVSAPAEDASTSDGTGESVDENTKNKTTAPEFKKENEAEILAWIESADPKDIAQAMLADFENARTVLPFFPKERGLMTITLTFFSTNFSGFCCCKISFS